MSHRSCESKENLRIRSTICKNDLNEVLQIFIKSLIKIWLVTESLNEASRCSCLCYIFHRSAIRFKFCGHRAAQRERINMCTRRVIARVPNCSILCKYCTCIRSWQQEKGCWCECASCSCAPQYLRLPPHFLSTRNMSSAATARAATTAPLIVTGSTHAGAPAFAGAPANPFLTHDQCTILTSMPSYEQYYGSLQINCIY